MQIHIDNSKIKQYIYYQLRRWVEQLAARRAHNPEAAGSSPAPAIEGICFLTGVFFCFKGNLNF